MGLLNWFRRRRKRPIVANHEGKSPYEQAKAIIGKQKVTIDLSYEIEKESEVTLEKFESKKAIPKRARTARGRYKGDDKSTPDFNEAWEGGKTPVKKGIKPKAKIIRVKKKK